MNFQAIVGKQCRGCGTESNSFLLEWLDGDPENPKSYNAVYKCSITGLIASMSLCVALASPTYSGAVGPLMEDFGVGEEVIILGLSPIVLGYAIGPLLWAPICEAYGRRNIFLITFAFYTLWTSVTCASQNISPALAFRFLVGVFGSSALVIPGGQIADMISLESRGLAIRVFCATPFVGPSLGPLIRGFLGDACGWR
jgi:MFS family permease